MKGGYEKSIQNYAKHSIGVKLDETKILGLPWNKETDELNFDCAGKRELLFS